MPRGRDWVAGEQLAQVDNRDPFAPPVWRSPVYRTPEPVIMVVQLVRLIWRVLWFALTHPGVDAVAALVVVTWLGLGWPGVVGLAADCRRRAGRAAGAAAGRGSPGSWRGRCGTGCGGGSTGAGGRPP